jgi:hypothetical protein
VRLVMNDACGMGACGFCGTPFALGNVVATAYGDLAPVAGWCGDEQTHAPPTDGRLGQICAECFTSGAETIRARAAQRAVDLAQEVLDHNRLVEALRTGVFDLPALTLEEYRAIAFPTALPAELGDDQVWAACE